MNKLRFLFTFSFLCLFQFIRCGEIIIINMCANERFKIVHMKTRPHRKELYRRQELGYLEYEIIKNVSIETDEDVWCAGHSWPGALITGALSYLPGIEQKGHYCDFKLKEPGNYMICITGTKPGRVCGGKIFAEIKKLGDEKESYIQKVIDITRTIIPEYNRIKSIAEFAREHIQFQNIQQLQFFKGIIEEFPFIRGCYFDLLKNIDQLSEKLAGDEASKGEEEFYQATVSFDSYPDSSSDSSIEELIQAEGHCNLAQDVLANKDSIDQEIVEMINRSREFTKELVNSIDLQEQSLPELSNIDFNAASAVPIKQLMLEEKIVFNAGQFAKMYDLDSLANGSLQAERLQNKKKYLCYIPRLKHIAETCRQAMKLLEIN